MIPNNGTTINLVRVAGDTDYLLGFVNTVGLTVYMFRDTSPQWFENFDTVVLSPDKSV